MPRAIDRQLERRWRECLRQFLRSGLSVREFCLAQDIHEHAFFRWRRTLARRDRLRETARSAAPPAPRHSASRRAKHQPRTAGAAHSHAAQPRRKSAFVPVELMPEQIAAGCFEIRLGAWLLRCPTSIEERALRQAIRVVREEATPC